MLRICTFGCMHVVGDGVLAGAATQPRRLAILALLARAGDRGMLRESVIALLWAETEEAQGRRILTKALSALRHDLGADDLFLGGPAELRLNPRVISSDVQEFESAMGEGDLERAATLYAGPFLQGFRLSGAAELERWVEEERQNLAREYELALEKLAATGSAKGSHTDAAKWGRMLAARDPLNARHALRLMRALADGGDRLAAIHHARVYESLVRQEVDLVPDREVMELASRLQDECAREGDRPLVPGEGPVLLSAGDGAGGPRDEAAPGPHAVESLDAPTVLPNVLRRVRVGIATRRLVGFGLVAIGAAWIARKPLVTGASSNGDVTPDSSVIAVGRIADYGRDSESAAIARQLGDMLATSLARVPELHVLSSSRLYELLPREQSVGDSGAALASAARRAGARRLIDGALYHRAGAELRLDLRLVDLAGGAVVGAHTVIGRDLFALVDSVTAVLAARVGGSVPSGSIADVSTRSMAAYRLYEEGLRAFHREQLESARRLFDAASSEDSAFAMAAYYGARTAIELGDWPSTWVHFARARRFAARATGRERLLIELGFATATSSPAFRALADSFVAGYPHEVEGHLQAGTVAAFEGRFADAVRHLERAIAMDSSGIHETTARCIACEALHQTMYAYEAMDSVAAMERQARRWTRLQPRSTTAWRWLSEALAIGARHDDALASLRTAAAFSRTKDEAEIEARLRIRSGDFATADRGLRDIARSADAGRRSGALWLLAVSLRQQGRLNEALAVAREFRHTVPAVDAIRGDAPTSAVMEGQVLFELGAHGPARALLDSIARVTGPEEIASLVGRMRAWRLAQSATVSAAAGDTTALRWMIDTIAAAGARSVYGRDRVLHRHFRGLLLAARGQREAAIAELGQAIYSPTLGFTRTNYELGRLLVAAGRPGEAVPHLQQALRGSVEASNLYVTRTEIHELLAQAWEAAGARDSAAAHYKIVVDAWAHADAMFGPRVANANRRLSALR